MVLGLLWSGNAFAETKKKDKDFVYLECRLKGVSAVMGYGLYPNQNMAVVPSPEKKIDFVELKTTPARYEFEYVSRIAKHTITINRFSGECKSDLHRFYFFFRGRQAKSVACFL